VSTKVEDFSLALLLDTIKQDGPIIFRGADKFDDIADALELEAMGLVEVSIKPSIERSRSTGIVWTARYITKKERRAAHRAAYRAAQQSKKAAPKMGALDRVLDAARVDGFDCACKGLGYKLMPASYEYGAFYAATNNRAIDRLFSRFIGRTYSAQADREEIRTEWLDGYRAGLDEVCAGASY
jgi:hypothetical protein